MRPGGGNFKGLDRRRMIAGAVFCLAGLLLPSWADEDAARDVFLRSERTLAALNSFQADFEQAYFSMTVSEPLREKGRLFYRKPGRMRWEYRGGSGQIIVLSDGVMETLIPEENQLIRQIIPDDQADGALFGLLSGRTGLADAYRIENNPFPGAEGPVHQLKLTPLEEGETAYLLVEIDARTFYLRRVVLFDWAGNKNEFTFSRLKTNPRLGPSVFAIEVPDGCEIIDNVDPRRR